MPYPHKLDEERILEEATRIVDESGIDSLSTRSLAHRLNVRAPSLYRYFPDKGALVQAVSKRFTAELAGQLATCATLHEIARVYWSYALHYPGRYDAMVRFAPRAEVAASQPSMESIEPLLAIASCIDSAAPLVTARVIRSYLHGAVMLHLLSPLADQRDEEEALTIGLDILARGLGCLADQEPRA